MLLSSQAVASLVVDGLWCLDLMARLFAGRRLVGGTEYFWDPRFPIAVRLLSLFHFVWPLLLIWALRRVGYDRRGYPLQCGIAVAVVAASRFVQPELNINFAHRDPFLGRAWRPAPLYLAVLLLVLIGLIYWPAHWVLARVLPDSKRQAPGASSV